MFHRTLPDGDRCHFRGQGPQGSGEGQDVEEASREGHPSSGPQGQAQEVRAGLGLAGLVGQRQTRPRSSVWRCKVIVYFVK